MENYSILTNLIILFGSFVPIYYFFRKVYRKSPPIVHVSGGHPLTGHTDKLHTDPVTFMKKCRDKYGSLYTVDYLNKRIIIFGKDWIGELFKNKNLQFSEAFNDIFLIHEVMGIIPHAHAPKMDLAKVVRSMITPYLKSYNTKIYYEIKLAEGEFFEGKDSVLIDNPPEIIRRMIVKASCSIMLGDRLCEDEEIINAFYNYLLKVELSTFTKMKYTKYPIIGRLYARYLINKEQMHNPYKELFFDKLTNEIEIRKNKESNKDYVKPNDVLQRLIDGNYNIEEITMLVLDMVVGSIMTTTNNCTFALYDMVTYPEYYDQLYQEQLEVQKIHGDQLNLDIIDQMSKLNSFVRESMRLRIGGIANFRYTKEDWTLSNGITIPKRSFLGVDAFSLHYDDELQGGDAYEFHPFRHFEKGKIATKIEPQNISFGLGQYACPGRFMAIQEIMTILSILIRSYKISTQDGKPHPYKVNPILFDLPKGEPLVFSKLSTQ